MQEDISKLYFEAHITIEPVLDGRIEVVKSLGAIYGFKVADLLMRKREQDTEERSKNDTFMTGHGKSLTNMTFRVRRMVELLTLHGFKVWRYKIEDTVMDSRTEDVLGLITESKPVPEPEHVESSSKVFKRFVDKFYEIE